MVGPAQAFARPRVGILLASCAAGFLLPSLFALAKTETLGPDAASVRMTTSLAVVSGCTSLGDAALSGEDGIALLREEAARRGADTIRLISLSGRDIRGELYRCAPASPAGRPTAAPSVVPSPSASIPPSPTPVPRTTPGAPSSLEARRRAAIERQRRAQQEFEDLKALVRVTSDPALVTTCEKRGEGRAPFENGEDALRGDAVGQAANVVLVRRTDSELHGEYFRCPWAQLQSIPRESAAPAH